MAFDRDEPMNDSHSSAPQTQKDPRKRKLHHDDMNNATQGLPQLDLPQFNLVAAEKLGNTESKSPEREQNTREQEWQTIENGRPTKKAKKLPKPHSENYPAITFSPSSRLQSQIKISDLQNLVLYLLADASAPQFVSVRHRNQFRKVVVLMVPGLEKSMFAMKSEYKGKANEAADPTHVSPDEYYPSRLIPEKLSSELFPLSTVFEYLWPVKTPGDDKYGRMHSPFHAMLTAPIPKTKGEKKHEKYGKGATLAKEPVGWQNVRTRVTEFLHPPEELLENDYTLHPASYDKENEKSALADHRHSTGAAAKDGWVDTLVSTFDEGTVAENEIESGSITAGRVLLAMDCEMCKTGEEEFSLTRISIVGWDGSVVLDKLVKPEKPIIDYLTMYVFRTFCLFL